MGVLENKKNKAFQKIVELSNELDKEVELSSEQIELGISDNISKLAAKAEDAVKKGQAKLKEFDSIKKDFAKVQKEYIAKEDKVRKLQSGTPEIAEKIAGSLPEKIDALRDKIKKAADDLGVDVKSLKGWSELNKADNALYDVYADIDAYNFDIK